MTNISSHGTSNEQNGTPKRTGNGTSKNNSETIENTEVLEIENFNGDTKQDIKQDIKMGKWDTNNNNNIYLLLFNKYKGEIFGKTFGEKIKKIGELKSSKEYEQLSEDLQDKLYAELMSLR